VRPPQPGDAVFCSSCGALLDRPADHTITLAKVDPLQDAPGTGDDTVVQLDQLPTGAVARGAQRSAGGRHVRARGSLTRLGRHPDSEIILDDITVSRRHAEISRSGDRYVVRDAGSLNGTYVNQERVDEVELRQGDELQVGKFRLVFFEMGAG
jgi:pSer/pThr/pTyr-binding forkhead associated (FHA) protein